MSQYGAFVMPFGEHKGKTLATIDATGHRQYIRWAANNVNDREVHTAAYSYLATTEDKQRAPLMLLPLAIAADTALSPGSKLVFAAIYTAANVGPDQRCLASNADLARVTGLSPKHIKRSLDDLEGNGMITRIMRDAGHRDHIAVVWRGDTMSPTTATSCPPWQEHFADARREDIRKPIRGAIKRREEITTEKAPWED